MKKIITAVSLALLSAAAIAQYTGPGPKPRYTGPSGMPAAPVKQLLEHGKDDQYATLRGRIVRYLGDKHYLFADQSGQMRVEIDPKHFPLHQPIDDKTTVEITGKLDKELLGKAELDVKQLRVIPK